MGFVYEKVKKEEQKLWKSIGFRDWSNQILGYFEGIIWFCNRERGIYIQEIGSFRGETPDYVDMSYKNRIIRMDVQDRSVLINEKDRVKIFKVKAIWIPKSVWNDKEDIINTIKEAFSVYKYGQIISSEVIIDCDAECVEADYNGK